MCSPRMRSLVLDHDIASYNAGFQAAKGPVKLDVLSRQQITHQTVLHEIALLESRDWTFMRHEELP